MVLLFDQAGLVDEGLAGVILFGTRDVLQDLYTEKVCLFGFIQARPELRNVAQRDASSTEQPVVFNLISCANPECPSVEHSTASTMPRNILFTLTYVLYFAGPH